MNTVTRLMRSTITMVILLTIIAGCGGNNTNEAQGGKISPETGQETEQITKDSKTDEANSTNQENAVRTIKDAKGEVTVPANPQRIIVLDNGALDDLLALGVKPIGAASVMSPGEPYSAYLKNTEGINNIGSINEPSLETIASLEPDLILGSLDTHDAIHSKLNQIAPTVFVETLGETWKDNLKLHAEAINKSAEGDRLLADYQKSIDEFQTAMGSRLSSTEITLVRPRTDKLQLYLGKSFSGIIVRDAGLLRPENQRDDVFSLNVTEEQIGDMDADAIIVFGREADYFNNKIKTNPLWATIRAVQENKVFEADWEVWLSGNGIQSANLIIDDLHKFLVE